MGRGQDLLDAARKGDEHSVEKILGQITKRSGPFTSLRRGAGVNVQDDNGYTPLHHACLQGHKEIVRLLLSVGASPCTADKKGATPLHLAAWKGDVDIVCMLLAHENPPVDVNQVTQDHETALLIAAQFGFVNVVAELMHRGADVNIRNLKDEGALDLAAQYGRLQTVKHLIYVHPKLVHQYKYPNWKVRKFSTTPLHRASMNGHKDVVQVLLRAGVDPNIRTDSGTPLHEAACFGKASVVRILLDAGADLNAVDGRDKTIQQLLDVYSEEATRRVRIAIREYKNKIRNNYESEEELPPFPVPDHSPTFYTPNPVKAQHTQIKNFTESPKTSSTPIKNPQQSFVKKLAAKCLFLKFNSAPNISNTSGLESSVESKSKQTVRKIHTNHNFFKNLLSREENGDIACNDEFDTKSLGEESLLSRDSSVYRSNTSCPEHLKTLLPNISENNEVNEFQEGIDSDNNEANQNLVTKDIETPVEAVNNECRNKTFHSDENINRTSTTFTSSLESAILVNECYETYDFYSKNMTGCPKPPPRSIQNDNALDTQKVAIYENICNEKSDFTPPTPAVRTHIPTKAPLDVTPKAEVYENVILQNEKPEPLKRSHLPFSLEPHQPSLSSRTSSTSSDSMIDESNLEDILLSEKSRSFCRKRTKQSDCNKSTLRSMTSTISQSSESNLTDVTGPSAIENVDCSEDVDNKTTYLSLTGTLPNPKSIKSKKKVLFRHKTFTNIEADRNSFHVRSPPSRNNSILRETLASYHIRGTGHCIYEAPTVQEFINIFNQDNLYTDEVPVNKRDSYFETAICFCRPRLRKHHNSAEDSLDWPPQDDDDAKLFIENWNKKAIETTFQCIGDTESCVSCVRNHDSSADLVLKFSAVKKSISTPNITLLPFSATDRLVDRRRSLVKNKSVSSIYEEPYAVMNMKDDRNRHDTTGLGVCNSIVADNDSDNNLYVQMSPHSTLSSSDRPYSIKDISDVISLYSNSATTDTNSPRVSDTPLRISNASEHSGWSLKSCNSNSTVSRMSYKTCLEESSDDGTDGSDGTLHSDNESSDAETVKSDVSTTKRPWVSSSSFRFGNRNSKESDVIKEEPLSFTNSNDSSKVESGISVQGSESSSSGCEGDSGVPRVDFDVSLDASLERDSGNVGGVRSGSGRRRWEEMEGASEGDALSVSSAASSCAPAHLAHHHEYNKVSPTPPKKPPRRNLSVSPTHVNSPSSGYSYELRTHARSQDDLDDIQGAKHYLQHGRSVDRYVDTKLSYSEYEENHNSPRAIPVPNPRPSLKNRTQPVAITAMYENVVIKEQNPRRKLRRNNLGSQYDNFEMADKRERKYSNQERSSLESLLDDQSMYSPSDNERYCDGSGVDIPSSPSHYKQPPTPDHPPPSAKQAENSIHERIRPLSQLIMEVVEEIRIRKKSEGNVFNS